jgi:hypothetical protein
VSGNGRFVIAGAPAARGNVGAAAVFSR